MSTFFAAVDKPSEAFAPVAASVHAAFLKGIPPLPIDDASGGAYFLRAATHRIVAVFKPRDEEPLAPHAPTRATPAAGRAGISPGEMAIREAMAFVADTDGFAGVPETALAHASHPRFRAPRPTTGSCQAYVPHDGVADDLGPAKFATRDVHAIALLDLRLFNADRHGGNLLVARGPRLVPIDHGCVLPAVHALGETHLCWLDWPQAHVPLEPAAVAYIRRLCSRATLAAWHRANPTTAFPTAAAVTLHLGTRFVQACVDHGMTVHEMGRLAVRADLDMAVPSPVERLVAAASAAHDPLQHRDAFLAAFAHGLERVLRSAKPTPRRLPFASPPRQKESAKVLLSTAA